MLAGATHKETGVWKWSGEGSKAVIKDSQSRNSVIRATALIDPVKHSTEVSIL